MSQIGHIPELESLRSQVAELTRALAEQDRSRWQHQAGLEQTMEDLREQSQLLRTIIEGTAAETGDDFFASLVTHLTTALDVQYAVVSEVTGEDRPAVRTLAVSAGGRLLENVEYPLEHAPCGTGLEEPFWCFERGVQALFPRFPTLAAWGVDSHCGVSLRTKAGTVIGLLIVMDTKPLRRSGGLRSLMEVFAARAAAELQRHRAERAMRRQERHLLAAQSLTHVGSWEWDLATDAVTWSDEQLRIFGHEPGSLVVTPETWLAALHPDDHDRVLAAINGAMVAGGAFDVECRIIRPNGDVRVIRGRGEARRDAAGRPITMDGAVLDITDHKRAEDALRAGEERWHLAVQGSRDGIWDWNIQTNEIFFSSRWKALRGYADEELPNSLDEWRSRIHPDDMERVLAALDAYLAKQRPHFCEEYRVQHKNGTYVWILDRGMALWDEQGRPVRMAGSETDITERVRHEETLRESEARTRAIIDTALDAVVSIDRDGLVIGWNPQAEAIFGYEVSEAIGRPLSELIIPPLYRPAHEAGIERVFRNAEGRPIRQRIESPALHRDGHEFPVEIAMTLTQVAGRPVFTAFIRDIAEQKQAETALRASEEFGRVVLDSLSAHIAVLDREGTIVAVNDAWQRFAVGDGASPLSGIRVGMNYLDLCRRAGGLDDQMRPILRGIDDVRAGRRSSFSTEYACHSAAEERWFVLRATPLAGGAGGVVITHENISERKQAEEALARSERQLRTVLNTLPVGICFTDAAGRVLMSNPASHRIWSHAKHVGLPADGELAAWWECAEGRTTPHRWALSRVLTTGEASLNELMDIECRDGTRKTISNSAVPVRDEQERITGAIVLNEDITARVRAEDELRRTHAFLQSIVENIPYMVTVKDAADFRYLMLNKAGEQLVGLSRHDLIGKTAYEVMCEADADRVFAADADALMQGGSLALSEQVLVNRSRGRRLLLTKKIPIAGDDGKPAYLLTICEDITEQKTAEEALRASEELFAKAFRSSPYPIVLSELESGLFLDANDASFEIFGYRPDELVGKTSADIGIWPSPEDRRCFIRRLKQAGSIRNLQVRLRNKTGELRQCLVSAELVHLHGKPCMVTVGHDITEQKRAEEELRRSHAFIRQVIDINPNFIFAKDRAGRFTLVNKAVAEAYGTTVDALIGKTDADFQAHREEVEFFRRKDLQVMDSLQEEFIAEERITDTAGQTRWLQTVKRPILDERGQATMVLGAATDITERKRMEEALRQRERDLRTALEERERISQDLHDGILQSLYAVGLGLESCKPLIAQCKHEEAFATVEQAVNRLNQIMTEVRNFIAGLESEVLQGGNLEAALRSVITSVTQAHPLRCRIRIDPEALPHITRECALHLLNILREALSNIVRHAKASRVSVSLRRLRRVIRLRIDDNGVGFDVRTAAGTGHGLGNMAARAKKVRTEFGLHSAPGEGTTIIVNVPKEEGYAHRESQTDPSPARGRS